MNALSTTQARYTDKLTSTELQAAEAMQIGGAVADEFTRDSLFTDYTDRKSINTVKSQQDDLKYFALYLIDAGVPNPQDTAADWAECMQEMPQCWVGVTFGWVSGFIKWQLNAGYAIGTINRRLSTVKTYAKLASQAGAIDDAQARLISAVTGYGHKEGKNQDQKRTQSRRTVSKKADAILLTDRQATQLKSQPATSQGLRDAALMALLLDHGLRISEVVLLTFGNIDAEFDTMTFTRPKVEGSDAEIGKHKLTPATRRALVAWKSYLGSRATADAPILWSTNRGGNLTKAGMTTIAASDRVRSLGVALDLYREEEHTTKGGKQKVKQVGTLSAHDCRHYAATHMAGWGYSVRELMDWFGWSSASTAMRYVESTETQERYRG